VLTVNVSRVRVHRRGSVSKRTTRDGQNVRAFILVSHLLLTEDEDYLLRDRVVICPRNAESEIDEGLVGVIILAPTFLRVDVAAGKVARREVKRVSSPNCVHMSFTFTLYYFMLKLLLPHLLLQRTRKCAV
jgi:hypothetical protein